MTTKSWSMVLFALGLMTLVTYWDGITKAMTTDDMANGRVVSQWSASGSPQKDKMGARRFMFEVAKEAEHNDEIEPVQANIYFSSTASSDDVVFVSSFREIHPTWWISIKANWLMRLQLDRFIRWMI